MEQAVSHWSTRFSNAKTNATVAWLHGLPCRPSPLRRCWTWLVVVALVLVPGTSTSSCSSHTAALDRRVHTVHATLVHAATRRKQSGRASLAAGGLPRRQSPWGKLRRRPRDAASDDTGDSPSTRRESGESSASIRRLRRASRPPWQRSAFSDRRLHARPPGPRHPVCSPHRRPTTYRQRRMLTPRANGHERRLRFGRRRTARVIVFAGARSSPWPRVCLCRTGLRPTC